MGAFSNGRNTIIFELKDDALAVYNNGALFSIEEKTGFVEFMKKFGVRSVPTQEQINLNPWECI